MNKITIIVSENKLKASITINAKGKAFPSSDEIDTAIRKAGVVYGIDEALIKDLIVRQRPVHDVVFARGEPPVKGKDAQLIWYVDLNTSLKPTITETGKADFKHINRYEPVDRGQELVSLLPPSNGISGKTVTGEPIRAVGKSIVLPVGKNTLLSEDGLTLYSAMAGYAFWKAGKVHVDNICHIKGDVDFSTGNVKFNGKIIINGDVRSGFRVEATDSIYIEGNVEAANIYSQKGDIVVRLGILGKGRAKVLAGGNLFCGFVQDATITVKKDVVINRYTMNSGISSGGNIVLRQNEGLIRGGKVLADRGVEAIEIGSDQKIATEVGISSNDFYEVDFERWDINNSINDLDQKLSALNKRIAFLKLIRSRFQKLSSEKRKVLAKTLEEIKNIESRIDKLKQQEKTLVEDDEKNHYLKSIVVRDKLYRGVTITIGHQQYYTDNLFRRVKIYRKNDKILFEELPET